MATNRFNAPRIRIPDVLERGKAFNAELPVYRSGSLVVPSAGTFELLDENGDSIVAQTAITVVSSIATYSLNAIDLPITLELSDNYMQIWRLVLPDSETYEYRRPTALARCALYPVISDLDLEGEYSSIDHLLGAGSTSFQSKIDEAWVRVIQKVRDMGSLPYLIMSPQSLRSVHLNLTLYLIFKDASSVGMGQDSTYMDHAREHRDLFNSEFKSLNFKYDVEQDGITDTKKRTVTPVIWTNRPPRHTRRINGFTR